MNSTDQRDRTLARGWRAVAFLAFALWGGFPAAVAGSFPNAGLPVVDTGVVVGKEALPIIWMDSDRIIFTALKTGASPTSPRAAQTRDVVIYDIRTGKLKKYADGAVSCYQAGRIVYLTEQLVWKDEAGVARFANRVMHGPVGQEKEELVPSERSLYFAGCSGSGVSRWLSVPQDRNITLLRPEHGYLDHGKTDRNNRVILVRPEGAPLPLAMYAYELRGAVYAPWADQYVLNASGAAFLPYIRHEPSPKPVIRLLRPDGELIELAPPDAFFKRFGSSGPIRLTRAGMVYTGLAGIPGEEQGLYLVNGQQVAQLVDGWVETMAVSPDGCWIALSSARDYHPLKYPRTIKVVRLCG